jgi:glycerophosphoryl diester phosphodiesterase
LKIPQIIAHRGGRTWAPENTLSAFRQALALGVDGIELDVQRCASGELVVIHDEDLQRTTNGVGLIRDCTLDELKRLSAGLWYDKEFRDERVPTLAEVLELLQGKCVLNIELKNTPIEYAGIEDDLMEVIEGYPLETLIISSFDHKLMDKMHKRAPELKIALLGSAVFLDVKQSATAIGAEYFHPEFDCLRADVVEEAHDAGLKVNVWTCNDVAKWRHCVKMGVDGIVTDDPEGLKQYLAPLMTAAESR